MKRLDLDRLFKQLDPYLKRVFQNQAETIGEYQKTNQNPPQAEPPREPQRVSLPPLEFAGEVWDKYKASQHNSETLQRRTFWATVFTFVAVAAYAVITYCQLQTMDRTYKEVHAQTVGQNRAVLAVDRDPEASLTGQIRIPLINHGHVSGKIISCHCEYIQDISYGTNVQVERTCSVNDPTVIAPGEEYNVIAQLPTLPEYRQGHGTWSVSVEGTIRYEDGFGNQESTYFCVSFNPKMMVWSRVCGSGAYVDFRVK